MKRIGNIKIAKKLGLLVAAGVLQAVCLTAVALWGIHTIESAAGDVQKESHKAELARQIASDIDEIQLEVAGSILTKRFDSKEADRIANLRKEYMADFAELAAITVTAEGQRRRELLEAAATAWREMDIRTIDLIGAGKFSDAGSVYRQQLEPRIGDVRSRLVDYMQYREQQMARLTAAESSAIVRTSMLLLVFAALWLAVSCTFGVAVAHNIAQPIERAAVLAEMVANGDLTKEPTHAEFERADEIGKLARAFQGMIDSLRRLVGNIDQEVGILHSSSTSLSSNSGQMTAGSREASEKAHSVAAAAEQMTANIVSVASGMEQATANLSNVANATEQMTSTIGEIASNSEKARRITEEATRQTAAISQQMNHLGEAAHEIGKVTETITEISSQTNLLALNATIEAARAGSAGKGFAVVANEIKTLAQQTAAATEDIKARIASVQTSTAAGIAEIGKVSHVIREVTDIVAAIAAAIEEQATVTKEIASSIGEASTGVRDASQRVSESSQATMDIAREIAGVDQAATKMAQGSGVVESSAGELAHVAEQLRAEVVRFRLSAGNAEDKSWTGRPELSQSHVPA